MGETSPGVMSMERVQPIRGIKHIQLIRRNLRKPKTAVWYALFVIGINTNLRVSDLRNLTWGQVWEQPEWQKEHSTMEWAEYIRVIEQKTHKKRRIFRNEPVTEALEYLYEHTRRPEPQNALFRNKQTRKAYSREYMCRYISQEARRVGITDPIGVHSLRKTWAYHAVVTFGQPITIIQAGLNHSNQRETMLYVGITDDELAKVHQVTAL